MSEIGGQARVDPLLELAAGREGGKEGGREGGCGVRRGKEGGSDGGKEGGRKGGKEGGRTFSLNHSRVRGSSLRGTSVVG